MACMERRVKGQKSGSHHRHASEAPINPNLDWIGTMGRARSTSSSRRARGRSKVARVSESDSRSATPSKPSQGVNEGTSEWVAPKKQNGSGMTVWWLGLSVLTVFFRFEQQVRQFLFSLDCLPEPIMHVVSEWVRVTSPNSTTSWIKLLQGASTVSALCVGIGYYTFKICFRHVQGSMSKQLYDNNKGSYPFPFWTFYVLDCAVHILVVVIMSYYWWKHVDSLSALLAWSYHRFWSFVHSRGESVYFTRVEEVYGFYKSMPTWSYILLYASETVIVAVALFVAHGKYVQ